MSNSERKPSNWRHSESKKLETIIAERGQITPRFIIGIAILIVMAGPLIAVAIDIQESLASTEVFSWFWAAVIAVLIVAAIVAAILGYE